MYQIIIGNPVTKTSYHVSPLNALNFATKAKVYHLKSHKSYDPFIVIKKVMRDDRHPIISLHYLTDQQAPQKAMFVGFL